MHEVVQFQGQGQGSFNVYTELARANHTVIIIDLFAAVQSEFVLNNNVVTTLKTLTQQTPGPTCFNSTTRDNAQSWSRVWKAESVLVRVWTLPSRSRLRIANTRGTIGVRSLRIHV